MKLISYARVSTDDKGQLPETQFLANRKWAAENKHDIVLEIADDGISGDTVFFQRPHGKQIRDALENGQADGIVVFSTDRFSRRPVFKAGSELEELRENCWAFVSVTEPFMNQDNEEMRDMSQFLSSLGARQFRKKLIVAVRAGMARAKVCTCKHKPEEHESTGSRKCTLCACVAYTQSTKTGKPMGRPKLTDQQVSSIKELHRQGMQMRAIAQAVGVSTGSVVNVVSHVSDGSS